MSDHQFLHASEMGDKSKEANPLGSFNSEIAPVSATRDGLKLDLSNIGEQKNVSFVSIMDESDKVTPLKRRAPEADTVVGATKEAGYSFVYSLDSAAKGVAQLADKTLGTDLKQSVPDMDLPAEAKFGSKRWYGQNIGGALAIAAPFMLVHGGVKRLGKTVAGTEVGQMAAASRLLDKPWKAAFLEGGISGGLYEFAGREVPDDGNFWQNRAKNFGVGFATFGPMTATPVGLGNYARSLSNPVAGKILGNEITSAAVSGIPAGISNTLADSYLHGKPLSGEDMYKNVVTFVSVGAGLGLKDMGKRTLGFDNKTFTDYAIDARENSLLNEGRQFGARDGLLTQKVASLKESARAKLQQARTAIDNLSDNLSLGMNPYGQLAFATAGNGARMSMMTPDVVRAKPLMMEAKATSLEPVREAPGLSRGSGKGTLLEALETGGKKPARSEKEAANDSVSGDHVKAAAVLNYHNLPEVADFVQSHKGWRNLEVNPDNTFHGNDALLVVEVKPSAKYPNGAMLKVVVPEGGWESDWGHRPGDAKLLSPVEEVELAGSGTAYLYLQELVDVRNRYDSHLLNDYFTGLEGKDLSFEEPGPNPNKQFGISQDSGKLVLVDYPSVGKPGHMRTLTELTQGADFFEREYDAENNANGRDLEAESEFDRLNALENSERDQTRQRLKETKQLDETQRDILEQLSSGVTAKEAAEYLALMRGELTPDGNPNVEKVMPEVKAIIKMAKEEGYNLQ